MRIPRWTVYPAVVVLGALLITAIPRDEADPYAGAARAALETESVAGGSGVSGGLDPVDHPRVVVLGIDGMDPDILAEVIELYPERMHNFRRLLEQGDGIRPLATSTPPQSPVAWSSFITGLDPGGHGIFDFIHRDPTTRAPLSSIVLTGDEPRFLHVPFSDYVLPLPFGDAGGSNRTGESFWSILKDHGVPADIWRMPANFPVEPSDGLSFPGMLTPALDSAYGECTFYTTDPVRKLETSYHKVVQVIERNGKIDTSIAGPVNLYRLEGGEQHPQTSTAIRIYVDREANAVTIDTGAKKVILSPGQWSDFMPVHFEMLPGVLDYMAGASGICRFYLRSVEPEFELYASPVNVDPTDPLNPVSEPEEASADLAEAIGLYYTQGMAEDVNALKDGVLTDAEFMRQVELVYLERVRMLDYALDHYMAKEEGGLLFFYFSTIDLACHMMWRHYDASHPHHDPAIADQDSSWWSGRAGSTWRDTVHDLYLKMDPVLGRIRQRVGEDALMIVMSDHGFAPYRREFNLNTWLLENGYLVLREGQSAELPPSSPDFREVHVWDVKQKKDEAGNPIGDPYTVVNWSKTRAYGIGFNGLYVNLAGRELDHPGTPADESGIVQPGAEYQALLAELKQKLEEVQDADTGLRPILRCDLASEIYHGERVLEAPDILVGFNAGYGNSDPAAIGRITHEIIEDNDGGTFNGSHLMAPEVVSGVLISNRPVREGDHGLKDLTVELLALYGIQPGAGMLGHRVLASD
ncbi:MAG: alkaline phosphatase family protein [Planctomycetota bacterium]|nr:alkaline phosphatase family protein [Planctomycetota bacterium]